MKEENEENDENYSHDSCSKRLTVHIVTILRRLDNAAREAAYTGLNCERPVERWNSRFHSFMSSVMQ